MATREDELEAENRALRAEVTELRTRCASLDGQFDGLRRTLDDLAAHQSALESMFVASSRLNAAQDLVEALRVVSDILRDLIGARRFAVRLEDERGQLVPVLQEEDATSLPEGDGLVREDLLLGERRVGSVTIFELFAQKQGLSDLDRELLALLGRQAASTLLAARVLSEREQKKTALQDFVRFLVEKPR